MILVFFKLNIKKIFEYRADFFLGFVLLILGQLVNLVFLYLIFEQIPTINGWRFDEMLLIYGFYTLCNGGYSLVFSNLRSTKAYLFSGELEIMLIRPISLIFHIIISAFNQNAIGEIILGFIITIYSLKKLSILITPVNTLLVICFFAFGTIILGSISILATTILFFTKGSFTPIDSIFTLIQFGKYPLPIFNKYIQMFLTWIIPFGFIGFYPSEYFLKNNHANFPILLVEILIVVIFFKLSICFFNYGLRKHEGVGN